MDEPVPNTSDSSNLNTENTRVNSLDVSASTARTPPSSITSFMDRPSPVEYTEDLRNKAEYINRRVDMETAKLSDETKAKFAADEDPIHTQTAKNEYEAIEDLNSPTANALFEAEGRNSIEIERTMGRDRAMQLLGEVKNLTDENIRTNKGMSELEAASGAIGKLTFQDPRFPELKNTELYSAVQGWTHAIIGINGLTAQAIDAKIRATREKLLKEDQNTNIGKAAR